jgi:hypothetical protein
VFTGPEDFVVTESLQLRNTHVYLNAAVWDWAATEPAERTCRDSGPMVAALFAVRPVRPPPRAITRTGHHQAQPATRPHAHTPARLGPQRSTAVRTHVLHPAPPRRPGVSRRTGGVGLGILATTPHPRPGAPDHGTARAAPHDRPPPHTSAPTRAVACDQQRS